MAEVSKILGEHSLTVMMDMRKCFDTVKVSALFQEAREVGFPLRLPRQLSTSYSAPRAVQGLGPISCSTRGGTGHIA
eukprot:1076237-Pyramimonas_sp.AAC.1